MMNQKLVKKIHRLKEDANAVILVHNYQLPEVQDIADILGDSLGLSRQAAETDADVIVFCGVLFMAETASILSPDKTVLLPVLDAGCPMVDMSPVESLIALKDQHPDAVVVTYVNSSAEVKALSDYCCTSANAVNVVRSLDPEVPVIFYPDQYLGAYVSSVTGRNLILHSGYCPTHAKLMPADIERMKKAHPEAKTIVHPECPPSITALADEVLSTSGMCRFAKESSAYEIIVGTEQDMTYRLQKENPNKVFYAASENLICPNMKKITLEDVCWALEEMQYVIDVQDDIRDEALKAVERMVQINE